MQDSPFKNIEVPTVGNPTVDINNDSLSLGGIVEGVLPWVFGTAGIILILNIISAGLKMMTSRGDPKALGAAQAKLSTSLIGILILFVSFWIVRLIGQFLGIGIFDQIFGTQNGVDLLPVI